MGKGEGEPLVDLSSRRILWAEVEGDQKVLNIDVFTEDSTEFHSKLRVPW